MPIPLRPRYGVRPLADGLATPALQLATEADSLRPAQDPRRHPRAGADYADATIRHRGTVQPTDPADEGVLVRLDFMDAVAFERGDEILFAHAATASRARL